jgi:hypothetical protein
MRFDAGIMTTSRTVIISSFNNVDCRAVGDFSRERSTGSTPEDGWRFQSSMAASVASSRLTATNLAFVITGFTNSERALTFYLGFDTQTRHPFKNAACTGWIQENQRHGAGTLLRPRKECFTAAVRGRGRPRPFLESTPLPSEFLESGLAEPARDRERAIDEAVVSDRGGGRTELASAADREADRVREFESYEYAFSLSR